MTEPARLTDAARLRAMAHPLRMGIVGSLRLDGPATSAILARRLGTDSGQTSHHLRLLARAGFVVEATELGKGARGRERWWKAAHESTDWPAEGAGAFEDAALTVWRQLADNYGRQGWSPEWRAAAGAGDMVIRTTPAGLAAMQEELRRVVDAHDLGGQADGTEKVVVIVQAYPHRSAQ